MLKTLLILGAVAGLVAAGVVEGMRTNRWGESEDASAAAARLTAVPATFGNWQSTDRTMDPQVQRVAGATGYVDRNFRNVATGEMVDVLLLCGPSGSIAAHTPDICFAGVGYAMKETAPIKRILSVPGVGNISYWSAKFQKEGNPTLLVTWGWGVNGDWAASDSPRRDFMLQQSLYKLYVTRRVFENDPEGVQALKSIETFLTEFVPSVKTALSSPPG